jgi:hypothetical protein
MGHPGLLVQDYVTSIPIWYIPNNGDDLPSPGRNFPGIFLPARELFSLGVFCPAEAAVSISEPP